MAKNFNTIEENISTTPIVDILPQEPTQTNPVDPVVPDYPTDELETIDDLKLNKIGKTKLIFRIGASNFKYRYGDGDWETYDNVIGEKIIKKTVIYTSDEIELPKLALYAHRNGSDGYFEDLFAGWTLLGDKGGEYVAGEAFKAPYYKIYNGCIGCGGCIPICSENAIYYDSGVCVINPELCTSCEKCVDSCPKGIISYCYPIENEFIARINNQTESQQTYYYSARFVEKPNSLTINGSTSGMVAIPGVKVAFYRGGVKVKEDVSDKGGSVTYSYDTAYEIDQVAVHIISVPNGYIKPQMDYILNGSLIRGGGEKTIQLDKEFDKNISGTVVDEYSDKPIRGVSISVKFNGKEIQNTKTDSNGKFSIDQLGSETFTITFTHKNCDEKIITINNNWAGGTIKLKPKYKVKVYTVSETGEVGVGGVGVKFGYQTPFVDGNGAFINTISLRSIKTISTGDYVGYVSASDLSNLDLVDYDKVLYAWIDDNVYSSQKMLLKAGVNYINRIKVFRKQPTTQKYENEFDIFKLMSAKAIKNAINIGNVEFISSNDDELWKVEVVEPDVINTLDVFNVSPVIIENNNKSILGSVDVRVKPNVNDLKLKTLHRYSGYYNPIFKDVLFYNNYEIKNEKNEKYYPFSNVSFDSEYEDKYGSFGIINNMWLHRINENSKNLIKTKKLYYPLIGEYALDYRDYNIFSNNWDKSYFIKSFLSDSTDIPTTVKGTKDMICMFGSKYINVPERLEIDGFNGISDWNDDWVSNPYDCPNEMMYREVNGNSVDFYFFLKKRIIRFFCNKLESAFGLTRVGDYQYLKFGIQEDIEKYVEKNILKLYELEKIRVFVKRKKVGQSDHTIENDYSSKIGSMSADLTKSGFIELKSVSMSKINMDNFDRKLTYNLRRGEQETFGFSFAIRRI